MSEDPKSWIGRTRAQPATLDAEVARRYAAAVGASLDVEATFPPLGHWAYFNDAVEPANLGPDGHPRRGLFMPASPLPRRMFASGTITFHAPLGLGAPARLSVTVTDVRQRTGRSGELLLVDVKRELAQLGGVRLTEVQTIAYRAAGEPTPAVAPAAAPPAGEAWRPGVVDLFRYSAATYNGHRIHYDRAYATGEEGYPDLVVHGPFTATKLYMLARRVAGAPLATFSFRALAPMFVDQPIYLREGDEPNTVVAVRCDGEVGMSASFTA